MKIWCQSCGVFGKDSAYFGYYEKALEKHAREIARPDTAVDIRGADIFAPGVDRYHASQNICTMQAVKKAIRAEQEGYDAFVMISTIDAGFYEIREMVDIPVVFMLENCVHFAMILAPKFAFLTHNDALLERLTEMTKQYGLAENMIPGGHLDYSYTIWPDMFEHPERYIDIVTQKAKEIIKRGARILIPSALPLGVWIVQQGLTDVDGCRIIDAFGCAVKMAELMVDLKKIGISRSKYGSPPKDILTTIQKLYKTG